MRLDGVRLNHTRRLLQYCLVQQRSEPIIIEDPEKDQERWDEPIIANDPKEAKKECQKRADKYGVELESVTEPRKVENRPQVDRCNYKEKE